LRRCDLAARPINLQHKFFQANNVPAHHALSFSRKSAVSSKSKKNNTEKWRCLFDFLDNRFERFISKPIFSTCTLQRKLAEHSAREQIDDLQDSERR